MYDKLSARQQNGLIYGFKLRYIGALRGLLGSKYQRDDIETFTQAERDQIERICTDAQARAKKCFEETRDRLDRKTSVGSGSAEEQRTYSGK